MKLTNEHIQLLLVEKIVGTIDAQDDLVIDELINKNPEVFRQWQKLQEQIQHAETQGFSVNADAEKSWERIAPLVKTRPPSGVFSLGKIAVAAAVFVLVIFGFYIFDHNRTADLRPVAKLPVVESRDAITLSADNGETIYLEKAGSGTFQLANATITTTPGRLTYTSATTATVGWSTVAIPAIMDYKILLSDGSEVWMNSETKLRFPLSFPGKTREVFIDGEAYFKVAKNEQQPFIVHTGEAVIQVLGTQFNVNTYDVNKIKTSLVEGAVALTANNTKVNLKPGFEAVYRTGFNGIKVESFDESDVLSWMKGIYFFHNTSLTDLSKMLSRCYNVRFRFNNSSLGNKTFSGKIDKNQPIQFFLDNIKISDEVNSDLKDGVISFW